MNAISPSASNAVQALSKSRGWLIAGGILSLIVGFFAIALPVLFSAILVQVLGALALVSGIISLFLSIFGKNIDHRILCALAALIRIAAGLALLIYVLPGMAALTLILAAFFIVEGIFSIGGALKMRKHAGWIWLFLNGIAALILGFLVYMKWPNDSAWVLGLLYGINSIFAGVSLLMFGILAPKVGSQASASPA